MVLVRFSLDCNHASSYLSTTKQSQSPLLHDIIQFAATSPMEFVQNSLVTRLIAVIGSFLVRV